MVSRYPLCEARSRTATLVWKWMLACAGGSKDGRSDLSWWSTCEMWQTHQPYGSLAHCNDEFRVVGRKSDASA